MILKIPTLIKTPRSLFLRALHNTLARDKYFMLSR